MIADTLVRAFVVIATSEGIKATLLGAEAVRGRPGRLSFELSMHPLVVIETVEEERVDPSRVIIGHCDTYLDLAYHRQILESGAYVAFALPENKVMGDKISARYVDGILHVTVPKSENAKVKPAKQIAVS